MSRLKLLPTELLTNVGTFLNDSELFNLSTSLDLELDWAFLGKRHPYLNIEKRNDFFRNPYVVNEEDVMSYCSNYDFAKKMFGIRIYNENGRTDHIFRAHTLEIFRFQLICLRLRELSNIVKSLKNLDLQIAITKQIEQCEENSEKELIELANYCKYRSITHPELKDACGDFLRHAKNQFYP